MMTIEDRPPKVHLLLVEDNPDDVDLTREAFKSGKLLLSMEVVDDGQKALAYLRKEPPYQQATTPDLILLDLNLPIMDGCTLLGKIKEDAELKRLPVVVLTTSESEEDIIRAYDLYANAYLTKPVDYHAFIELIHTIEDFWFTLVKLPLHP